MIKVEPEIEINQQFKINSIHTTLIQTGNAINDNWFWFNNSKINPILKEYTDKIEQYINYYNEYHQNSENIPIFLMYGPNGCGKTRIVEDVCKKLSMHLFKVYAFLKF